MHGKLNLIPDWNRLNYWIDCLILMIFLPVVSAVSILADVKSDGLAMLWWPSAIPLIVYWFRGENRWPAILIGYLIHYYVTHPYGDTGRYDIDWLLAIANTVEAIGILVLLRRLNVREPFRVWQDTKRFLFCGILLIGILTSVMGNVLFWVKGLGEGWTGICWWYAGNVIPALVLIPFAMVFGHPGGHASRQTNPGLWGIIIFLSLAISVSSYLPMIGVPYEYRCAITFLFLPLYLMASFLLGTVGVVSILLIGGIFSNISYSQGFLICYESGSIPIFVLWIFMILIPLFFLLFSAHLDHRKRQNSSA